MNGILFPRLIICISVQKWVGEGWMRKGAGKHNSHLQFKIYDEDYYRHDQNKIS